MKLRVLVVGKLKDPGLEALVESYLKRSRALLPIEFTVLRDLSGLRSRTQSSAFKVVLDERGEQVDTMQLSTWLKIWREQGARQIDFLIGDAHGFTPEDRHQATRVLALSKLTLPHRIAQVMLVEQLYRVGTILSGHPYHHR